MRCPRLSPLDRIDTRKLINPAKGAVAALVVVMTSLALTARPAAAAPLYTLEDRASAIASPSLVFLEFRFEGYMRNRTTGAPVEPDPIAVYSRCNGLVVQSDGYVVTTTHCLHPEDLRFTAASLLADNFVRDGKLAAGQKDGFLNQVLQTADFTGNSARAAPAVTVTAQMYTAVTGSANAKTIPATVVDAQATADGETALIKLDQGALPVAQLVDTPLSTNLRVVEMAFSANDPDPAKASYTVKARSGAVVGAYGDGTPPRYALDADLGANTNGGMVTDGDGKVLGMITADFTAKEPTDRTNKIVTPSSTIVNLLSANGVKNALRPSDQTYRDGLNAYFGGRYNDAIKKFDAVIAASPNNAVAQSFRKQAADRLAIEGDAGSGTSQVLVVILAIVAGLALLGLMGVAAWMVVRGRRREREFTYFDPYTSPNPYPTSSGPVSAPTSGWPAAAPTSGFPAPTSGFPQAAPTSGMPPTGPVPVVPISAVPASPFEPPTLDGFYHPPAPEPPTTYPVVVPVPPPTPMSVSPQYGQALPDPWGPPVGPVPVPVPQPAEPSTGTVYQSAAPPSTPPSTPPPTPPWTPPEAPTTAPPAGPPVGTEPPTGQPWDVPDDERMFGSPPDAYRHRP